MLDGGVDPLYIARRLMRMAVEDIGLADPRAMEVTTNAVDIYERLGSPEGELALANAVVYLSVAPKSISVYQAFNKMRALCKKGRNETRSDAYQKCADQADERYRQRSGVSLSSG